MLFDTFKERLHYFVLGVARLFDLGGTLSDRVKILSDEEAWECNRKAIESDWEVVGSDMWQAIEKFEKDHRIYITNE